MIALGKIREKRHEIRRCAAGCDVAQQGPFKKTVFQGFALHKFSYGFGVRLENSIKVMYTTTIDEDSVNP